jgi:hypothetical protein
MLYHETPFYVISTWCRLRLVEAVVLEHVQFRREPKQDSPLSTDPSGSIVLSSGPTRDQGHVQAQEVTN